MNRRQIKRGEFIMKKLKIAVSNFDEDALCFSQLNATIAATKKYLDDVPENRDVYGAYVAAQSFKEYYEGSTSTKVYFGTEGVVV